MAAAGWEQFPEKLKNVTTKPFFNVKKKNWTTTVTNIGTYQLRRQKLSLLLSLQFVRLDSADMLILLLRWNPISYIFSLLRSTLGRSMSRVRVSLVRLHISAAADPLSKQKVRSTKLKWTSIYTFSHTRKLSKHTCCAAAIIKQQRFSGFCRAQLVNVSESDKELVLLGQSTILS